MSQAREPTALEQALKRFDFEREWYQFEMNERNQPADHQEPFRAAMVRAGRAYGRYDPVLFRMLNKHLFSGVI